MDITNEDNICPICCISYGDDCYIVRCHRCLYDTCNNCIVRYNVASKHLNELTCVNDKCHGTLNIIDLMEVMNKDDSETIKDKYIEHVLKKESQYMHNSYQKYLSIKLRENINENNKLLKELASPDNMKLITHDGPTYRLEELLKLENDKQMLIKKLREIRLDNNSISKRCTINNCPGYINSKGICYTCMTSICIKCDKQISNIDEHVCDEDDIMTVKVLKEATKPCPRCGVSIEKKPNTCDQMWCVNCNTAFDWVTMKELDPSVGNYHNDLHSELIKGIRNNNYFNEKTFNCFIRGEISMDDIKYFPDDNNVKSVITDLVSLEQLIIDNTPITSGPDLYESLRMKTFNMDKSIDDPEIIEIYKTEIESNLRRFSLIKTYNDIFKSYSNCCKDTLLYLGGQKTKNDNILEDYMLQHFASSIMLLKSWYTKFLDNMDNKSNRSSMPRDDRNSIILEQMCQILKNVDGISVNL